MDNIVCRQIYYHKKISISVWEWDHKRLFTHAEGDDSVGYDSIQEIGLIKGW